MNLTQLPTEILRKIATHVDDMAPLEAAEIRARRWSRCVWGDEFWGGGEIWFSCLHDEAPILNSIQTLGAVNKQLYRICAPILWKKLYFPTVLPIPLDFFTKTILPKYGQHVRSLSVTISTLRTYSPIKKLRRDMSGKENVVQYMADDDKNKVMSGFELELNGNRTMCSPVTLMGILFQCQNLQELELVPSFWGGWDKLDDYYKTDDQDDAHELESSDEVSKQDSGCDENDEDVLQSNDESDLHNLEADEDEEEYDISDPYDEEGVELHSVDPTYDAETFKEYANGVNAFMVSLIEPLSKLANLRHLGVRCQVHNCSERGIAQLVATLPHLTSFAGEKIGLLSERQIWHRKSQTLGWQLSRLKHLTKLELFRIFLKDTTWFHNAWCSELSSLTLSGCKKDHKFSQIFASSLVQLKLKPYESTSHSYNLPQLCELYLRESLSTELVHFAECPNLRRIVCEYKSWTLPKPAIIQHWQSLQRLQMIEQNTIYRDPRTTKIAEWREFCDGADILFVFNQSPGDPFRARDYFLF